MIPKAKKQMISEKKMKIAVGWHPEKQDDEVYVGNVTEQTFTGSDWSTKRLGKVTYGQDKKVINNPGFRPMFVKKSELIEAGFEITNSEDIFNP